MNIKRIFKDMTQEEKREIVKLLFNEEVKEFFKRYDEADAITLASYDYRMFEVPGGLLLRDDIEGYAPDFSPSALEAAVGVKWIAKYQFTQCIEYFGRTKTIEAIDKALPDANIIIATPSVLNEVLTTETKEKIINKLLW